MNLTLLQRYSSSVSGTILSISSTNGTTQAFSAAIPIPDLTFMVSARVEMVGLKGASNGALALGILEYEQSGGAITASTTRPLIGSTTVTGFAASPVVTGVTGMSKIISAISGTPTYDGALWASFYNTILSTAQPGAINGPVVASLQAFTAAFTEGTASVTDILFYGLRAR